MGNCQAIDNATLLLQHPNGRVDKMYFPVTASEIMKMNPGHYVALLLTTTTLCQPHNTAASGATATSKSGGSASTNSNAPVRITRIKLLRPTDTLVLGHVYRLITTQEVMKGLWAKKCAKMKQQQQSESAEKQERMTKNSSFDFEAIVGRSELENTKQGKHEKQRQRTTPPSANSAASKSRTWQPRLHSISEAGS